MSSSEEEEKKIQESFISNEIREIHKMWETVQNCVEKYHPNKAIAVQAMSLLMTIQCHISTKSSKGSKSKCHHKFLVKAGYT